MRALCKNCGNELKKKYFKKYGIILLVTCPPMFVFMMFIAYGTIMPFLYVLYAGSIGCFYIFRKDKYFYCCMNCKSRFVVSDFIKDK